MSEKQDAEGLPDFAGKPVRDLPVPTAKLWREDEFGSAVLAEYLARVRQDFDENPFLKIFKVAAGIVHGSNPFAVCLVDMIVRPTVRVATPVDLHVILNSRGKTSDPVKMRGGYKDAGLVLRSVKEPNSYFAERLVEQLDPKMEWPVCVHLSGLILMKDPDSPCGLSFELGPDSRAYHAPVLAEKSGHFDNANVDPVTGLPTAIEGTGRYFYGMDEGLSRLYLGRGSSIDTIWEELDNSQVDGRVVLVDNSVPPETMSEYVKQLDRARRLLDL